MKKNILGALAILFITVSFLLVINDLSKTNDSPIQVNIDTAPQQADLVGLDNE
ncbi:hypothetical protein [Gelidibacter mesophilus]|uniref:hypothetical protein n=1 Tax=Gelidibacter mesophilus TaxID=169050 RepID=UPI00040F3B3B|nr:hypothetical protein [Gelidibacter mesophilus]